MTVTINNVKKYYGADLILDEISTNIAPGDRIGLVGRNGAGKTTLLRVISGAELCDQGNVDISRNTKVGYLDQEISHDSSDHEQSGTIRHFLMPALEELLEMGRQLAELEKQMANLGDNPDEMETVLSRYANLATRFEHEGGYEIEAKIKRTVQGLGIDYGELDRTISELSGGERVRVGLARLLLSEPDLLLLDEPTNHLDMKAIEWLESYLAEATCSLVIVSHDRYFLDKVVSQIWEVQGRKLTRYSGNYSAYMHQRDENRLRQSKLYKQQQEEIQKLEGYVRKYMAGNRSTMAKSRLKRLEKIERIGNPAEEESMRFSFTPNKQTGKVVFRVDDVHKSYDQPVLKGISFDVRRGERLGIVGPNGTGKTTLLSILAGRQIADKGQVLPGHQVDIGFYSQTLEELNEENTVLEEILSVRNLPFGEARSFLARFLFFADEVFSKAKTLSGGEKARLSLAKLLLSESNVLLLDEPTNHLDISARTSLEEALDEFPGTIIMVSHDRYFLDQVASHILVMEEGQARKFEGNYTTYRSAIAAERVRETQLAAKQRPVRQGPSLSKKKREDERKVLEKTIEEMEQELSTLEEVMGDISLYQDGERAQEVVNRHRELETSLAELYEQWESFEEDLNRAEEN